MGGPINFPPFQNALNLQAIDSLINWASINVLWMKNHSCPCIGESGSPRANCNVCLGRGFYWDAPSGPYGVLITLITWIGRNVDMGNAMHQDYGTIFQGHPIITIPVNVAPLWTQANTKDIIVEYDTIMRFQASLMVGEREILPAWHVLDPSALTIPPSGAVIVENPSFNQPVSGVPYNYNPTTGKITLLPTVEFPTGWPTGTSYIVEYYSPLTFVIDEPFGGLAHVRPFGQGLKYPRRWKMTLLDVWLRDKIGLSSNLAQNS
jgi:hypothetical protein